MLNNWADCINYARSLKAGSLSGYNMIVSMSLGYDNTNTNLNNAIANAEDEGIIVCTSAGNDGPSPNTTAYPANLADTTSVAAAGYVGLTGAYGLTGIWTDIPENDFSDVFVSDFSSRGKVDVTGIGENLVLPYYGGYYYISGTSFSCPQTSGVFALMFERFGSQTVAWLEGHLQDTSVDLGYDVTVQGAGFIQADGATA
jgi:subtilisin family serine protease